VLFINLLDHTDHTRSGWC